MTLRPDDRALAAFLLERDLVAFDDLVKAMRDASSSVRDLGESLVRLGTLDPPAVLGLRAEVAKRAHFVRRDDPTLPEIKKRNDFDTPADDDDDTWFDLPAAKVHIPKDLTPTSAPTGEMREEEAFAPTRPYSPATSDVLSPATIRPGSKRPLDPQITDPRVSDPWPDDEFSATVHRSISSPELDDPFATGDDRTRMQDSPGVEGVDLKITQQNERLAPSGKTIDERYQMLGEIARGGMGRILKAHDTEIGREVAVKVLLGGKEAPENLIRRFWMEVQATGQLEHPSIIPIHDVGRLASGELFYVMKKLSGQTLADIIQQLRDGEARSEGEFTRVRLLTIFQQIAYAVAFAHARGVVHRDIKPANIMVGRYGEAMLLDWGLAKIVEQQADGDDQLPRVKTLGRYVAGSTVSGTITGTPQYMSPEATSGQPEQITTKSDVYGLGAVLYEILTFEPPFPDLGFVPTVVKVRKAEFMPPRELAPHRAISEELEELVLNAMSKDPHQRPNARSLADAIGVFLEGARERERRSTEARQFVREGRRATDKWKQLKLELQTAESESKRLAKEVPPSAAVERKQPIWALEDRVSELKIEAISAFEESEAAFLRALGEVPDEKEARSALASLYFARFGEAERARDGEAQRYYRNLVARYDDGNWSRVLAGDGSLQIINALHDVEVSIARMESHQRILRAGESRRLGRGSIGRFDVPIGSYLLTFKRFGERDVHRPVLIGRTESVTVHFTFRSSLEIGEAFVLIPEGPAILGGDSIAHGGLDRRVLEIGEFAIARFPVTCEEYLAFINALAEESLERAQQHVPRARAQEGHYWRYNREERRFVYPEKSPGGHTWVGTLPVTAISMEDAEAYLAWRSSLTGESLRLPHENEWEKAARGVDGRFFPWGDHFDPTFCKMKESRDRPYPEPEPVGAFPTDRSPYGVRDMAGGVRELCMTEEAGALRPVMRGGCWSDTGLFCRVAFRHVTQRDFVNTGLGFRLVKDLV
jgi:serine/threonine-protein kinase